MSHISEQETIGTPSVSHGRCGLFGFAMLNTSDELLSECLVPKENETEYHQQKNQKCFHLFICCADVPIFIVHVRKTIETSFLRFILI